jgi:predicted transcriptional regulator YdeE
MTPEIRTTPLAATLLGTSLPHDASKSYGQEIKLLLDRVWPVLKAGSIPNKGISWVVYDGCARVFVGVEATVADPASVGLEQRTIELDQYAWVKHIGPVSRLGDAYVAIKKAIADHGVRGGQPQIEVYGHWTSDESKFETELIIPVS